MTRQVLLVTHPGRAGATAAAREAVHRLTEAGIGVCTVPGQAGELPVDQVGVVEPDAAAAAGCELVLVLGGDGTILRAAELARPAGLPVMSVNLGRVGFLAEAERHDLGEVVQRVADRSYTVEERLTVEATVVIGGEAVAHDWALNEFAIAKTAMHKILDVLLEVDGRPLSRWGCDAVVVATPTGSTAYAFSAGGPVVWPQVQALLVVPVAAHALFARPLVVSPSSLLALEVLRDSPDDAVLWADGRRTVPLPSTARVEIRSGSEPVRFARLGDEPFTDRLVAKFELPVHGWRGAPGSG